MQVRAYEPRDFERLWRLFHAVDVYYEGGAAPAPGRVRDYVRDEVLAPGSAMRIVMAFDGDEAIGFAAWALLHPGPGASGQAQLKELFVRQRYRGRGAGRALMTLMAEQALALGCVRLDWTADAGNPGALRFYRGLGAAPLDEKRYFRMSGDALRRLTGGWPAKPGEPDATDTTAGDRSDGAVLAAWERNAAPWTEAVRTGAIESRRMVTDEAVVEAVLAGAPRSVLDIGCGEGWLARRLAAAGVAVTGVDAVHALVERAREQGGGEFRALSYEELARGALRLRADCAVCNFSLIGKESVESLLAAVPRLLAPGGRLVVQTLHPASACGEAPYADGWRPGSWDGIEGNFAAPAPWYFRTLGGWLALLGASGMTLQELREPLHPRTGQPASVIFVARSAQ